jgi:hypothetical protein
VMMYGRRMFLHLSKRCSMPGYIGAWHAA